MPSTFIAIDYINNAIDERVNALRDTIYINSLSDLDIYITNGSCYRVRMNANGGYAWYNLTVSTKIIGGVHVPMQILSDNDGYMVRTKGQDDKWQEWNSLANIHPIKCYTTIGNNKSGGKKYLTLEFPKGYISTQDEVVFVRYVRTTNRRSLSFISDKTYTSRKKAWKEMRNPVIRLRLSDCANFNDSYREERLRIESDEYADMSLADYLYSFHKEVKGATGKNNNVHILGKQLGVYIKRNGMRISDYIPFRLVRTNNGNVTISI